MKMRILLWTVLVAAVAFILFGAENWLLQREISERTLRLHVVANSDDAEDQAQKLVVRDAVLRCVSELTGECTSAAQAQSVLAANLDSVRQAAQSVSTYEVSVSLGEEAFDTRYYETFTMPAGTYTALRVNIGAAEGKNWWCVVFPSLCVSATSEAVEKTARTAGFSDAQTEFMVGGEERYVFRFKSLQWIKNILDFF